MFAHISYFQAPYILGVGWSVNIFSQLTGPHAAILSLSLRKPLVSVQRHRGLAWLQAAATSQSNG